MGASADRPGGDRAPASRRCSARCSTAKGYQSDYDLLIIVNHEKLTDRVEFWATAEERLNRELAITGTLRTPVNFIVHTLQEVNDGLAHGRYFFMDVARDGIALYQSDGTELPEPKPKTPKQALAMAREYFEEWLPTAQSFQRGYGYALRDGDLKKAAFDLHQATERLYHCVLLVCTFYTPHVHNLGFLRTQAERIDRRLTQTPEAKDDRSVAVTPGSRSGRCPAKPSRPHCFPRLLAHPPRGSK